MYEGIPSAEFMHISTFQAYYFWMKEKKKELEGRREYYLVICDNTNIICMHLLAIAAVC